MVVIGLTGGICSGKSTVTHLLSKNYEAVVIDADKLGHEAYEVGTACHQQLVTHFGSGIVTSDGQIDRRALGAIVFGDKTKMNELQSIVWPCIREKIMIRLEQLKQEQNPNVIVVEAAVMIEAGWQDLMDTVWVVTVDPEVAIERLMKRNNFSEEEAKKRVSAQISNEERCRHANVVIRNTGDFSTLEEAVASAMSS
jgi:dephospho-CoA kinase